MVLWRHSRRLTNQCNGKLTRPSALATPVLSPPQAPLISDVRRRRQIVQIASAIQSRKQIYDQWSALRCQLKLVLCMGAAYVYPCYIVTARGLGAMANRTRDWEAVSRTLTEASKFLPETTVQSEHGYSKHDFDDYLASNELQLAMDELSGVIEDNPSPGAEFWSLLIDAAKSMKLVSEVERYQAILKLCHG